VNVAIWQEPSSAKKKKKRVPWAPPYNSSGFGPGLAIDPVPGDIVGAEEEEKLKLFYLTNGGDGEDHEQPGGAGVHSPGRG
jgi:hypothetical protein